MSDWGVRNYMVHTSEQSQENLEDLFVFGYQCKVFRDDEKAKFLEEGRHLIPWMGDPSLLIDRIFGLAERYDGRGHLYDISVYDADVNKHKIAPLSDDEQHLEALLDEERYLELHTDIMERQVYEEEEAKRLNQELSEDASSYGAVAFNYDDPGGSYQQQQPAQEQSGYAEYAQQQQQQQEQAVVKEEVTEEEAYVAPPELKVPQDMYAPPTIKMYAIIEKTAKFISQQGGQMEIVIKTKQKDNPLFDFLNYSHYLNPFYRHLVQMLKSGKFRIANKPKPPSDPFQDSDAQNPEGHIVEIDSKKFLESVRSKVPAGQIANTPYAKLVTKMAKHTAGRNSPDPNKIARRSSPVPVSGSGDPGAPQYGAMPPPVSHSGRHMHYGQQTQPAGPPPPTGPPPHMYNMGSRPDMYGAAVAPPGSTSGAGPSSSSSSLPPPPGMEPVTLPTSNQPPPPGTVPPEPPLPQPQHHAPQLQHHGQQPQHHAPQPQPYESQPQPYEQQPQPYEQQPQSYEPQPQPHAPQLHGAHNNHNNGHFHGPAAAPVAPVAPVAMPPSQPAGIFPPPPDLQPIIDKMASYAAKNGPEFEYMMKMKRDDRFAFLLSWHVHNPYYENKKKTYGEEFAEEKRLKEAREAELEAERQAEEARQREIEAQIKQQQLDYEQYGPVNQPKAVSFSIKQKPKDTETPTISSKAALLYESSDEEGEDGEKIVKTEPAAPVPVPEPEIPVPVPVPVKEEKIEKPQVSTEELEKIEKKHAEEKLKDKLATAAREKLNQANKEKQIQAERKRRAAMFLTMLNKPGTSTSPARTEDAASKGSSVMSTSPPGSAHPSRSTSPVRSHASSPLRASSTKSNTPARSASPFSSYKRKKSRSRSKSRSRTPRRRWRSRSRSPRRRKRSKTPPSSYSVVRRSRSPPKKKKSRSKSPVAIKKRNRRSRSRSKGRTKKRSRSKSPKVKSKKRSRSPKHKKKSKESGKSKRPSKSRSKSPVKSEEKEESKPEPVKEPSPIPFAKTKSMSPTLSLVDKIIEKSLRTGSLSSSEEESGVSPKRLKQAATVVEVDSGTDDGKEPGEIEVTSVSEVPSPVVPEEKPEKVEEKIEKPPKEKSKKSSRRHSPSRQKSSHRSPEKKKKKKKKKSRSRSRSPLYRRKSRSRSHSRTPAVIDDDTVIQINDDDPDVTIIPDPEEEKAIHLSSFKPPEDNNSQDSKDSSELNGTDLRSKIRAMLRATRQEEL